MHYSRVNEIDLLRFIAALAVVFFHYTFRGYAADGLSIMPYPLLAPVAKYGYLGANLFFMISGFVILMTAEHGSLRSFVTSRVVRLYPAFWACCTITFVVTLFLGPPRFSATLSQYLANMTMLNGFAGVNWIDGSYWTLFVEVKFYALVCAVLVTGRMRRVEFILTAWLLVSILAAYWPNKYLRYFLTVDYSAYFIAGATCFLIWSRGRSATRSVLLLLCWSLALFQSGKMVADMREHYNMDVGTYVSGALITLFFVVMVLVALRATGVFGRTRWVVAGALTYPLYLIHQHVGYMIFDAAYPAVNAHVLLWGTLVAMLAVAYAVHVHIERRFSPALKHAIDHLVESSGRLRRRLLSRFRLFLRTRTSR
jgi:peptidoglycan/LPS O-acetylase OafA/YrhL